MRHPETDAHKNLIYVEPKGNSSYQADKHLTIGMVRGAPRKIAKQREVLFSYSTVCITAKSVQAKVGVNMSLQVSVDIDEAHRTAPGNDPATVVL